MRLHSLRISAFGPYAATEHVDFDTLNDAGIFLLHGATGAGKTSILDAVCFAIFGTVPGTRGPAGRLRSDHSSPDVATEVRLELSVRGRRLRFTRSPGWERPKKRGSGTTKEQPRVLLEEITCDARRVVSTRLDETGHFVRELFGMTAEQFCQVVLLPQGRFADFLRADAESRRALLEQLFATQRFTVAEGYLADMRRAMARDVDDAAVEIGTVLARIAQAAGLPQQVVPAVDAGAPSYTADEGPSAAPTSPPAQWAADTLAAALRAADKARTAETSAAGAHRRARADHERVCALARQQTRRREALEALAALEQSADDVADLTAALERGRRAATLRPVLRSLDEAERAAAAASAAEGRCRTDLAPHLPAAEAGATEATATVITPTQLRHMLAGISADIERLADLADDDDACRQTRQVLAALTSERTKLLTAAQRAEAETERLTTALLTAEKSERIANDAAAQLPGLDETVRAAKARAEAAARRDSARAEVAVLDQQWRAAVDQAQARRAHWLDLRQQRLDGMAAELAASLDSGNACPVCGATEHPAPATANQGTKTANGAEDQRPAVLADLESAALEAAETADEHRRLLADGLAAARSALAAATAVAGDAAAAELQAALPRAIAQRDALALQAAKVDARRAAVQTTAESLEQARAALQECRLRAAECETQLRHSTEELSVREERLARACGDDASLAARRDRLTSAQAALEAALAGCEASARADAAVLSAREAAALAAEEARFPSVSVAREALVDDARLQAWDDQLRAAHEARARVTAVLSEPEVRAVEHEFPADVETAGSRLAEAEAAHIAAGAARGTSEASAIALEHLVVELTAMLRDYGPVRTRFAEVDALSRLVEGTSGDNSLRMRLSAYVLAARLEQVAAAAGERLVRMTGGRYSVVHCDEGATARGRAGLGLRIVDFWTGCERDPATLSGGETFTASLALALGLADVATAEAGGVLLDTLLVDEGFGSLDEDSLEEVLEVLDGLREGGRVVGLVSHVGELRSRIPAQLRVLKDRSGSRIVQEAAAALPVGPGVAAVA